MVFATGGLSHWVGLPESGTSTKSSTATSSTALATATPRLTDYTGEEIDAAGNGAHEIRTWLVAAGAAGVGFDVLAYEPVPVWLTGTAVAAAALTARPDTCDLRLLEEQRQEETTK